MKGSDPEHPSYRPISVSEFQMWSSYFKVKAQLREQQQK